MSTIVWTSYILFFRFFSKFLKNCKPGVANQEYQTFPHLGLINPFVPNAPFLYPLKTSEKFTVFLCFQWVEKGCIRNGWVIFVLLLFLGSNDTTDMNSILLVILTLWSMLPVVATAPTLPPLAKGFDLQKEMDVFKDSLRKQFETARMKVEIAKLKECEEIKDCVNQKNLLKELKDSIEGFNATTENLSSKTTETLTTATGG